MSAGAVLRAALLARLRDDPAVAVTRVVEGASARGTVPFASLRDLGATDWGTKDRAGREVRIAVTVRDDGETPVRAEAIAGAAEAAVLAMPRELPGWRVASAVTVRTMVSAQGEGRWAAQVDFRVRMLAD
jgi:hypothetical protein